MLGTMQRYDFLHINTFWNEKRRGCRFISIYIKSLFLLNQLQNIKLPIMLLGNWC